MTLRARWILPLLDLLLCFALTTPLHRYIAPKPKNLSPEVILLTRDIELPPLPVSGPVARTATSIESHLGLNFEVWEPWIINVPTLWFAVPYVAISQDKQEWAPRGMDFLSWRTISWPIIGILFFYIGGRGIEAFLALLKKQIEPRLAWFDMAFSVMSFLASLVLLSGLIFARDLLEEVHTSFVFSVGVMWLFLSTNCFACRVWQWRLRRKLVYAI